MYVGPHVGSVVDLLLAAPVPRAPSRGARLTAEPRAHSSSGFLSESLRLIRT